MTGRCLIGQARLPMRRRRISNFFAGSDSAPRLSSIGPAVLTGTFPPQGHHSPVAAISSPKAGDTGRALNWVERGQPLTHGAASLVAAFSLPWAPGGRVERVGSATASFLHLGRRPAKNAAQHIAKSLCPVAPSVFGSAHERDHEGVPSREVVNLCQGFGNVCRA